MNRKPEPEDGWRVLRRILRHLIACTEAVYDSNLQPTLIALLADEAGPLSEIIRYFDPLEQHSYEWPDDEAA
jgi:hypothetical protein